MVIGQEVGELGTPHLQGYLYLYNAKSLRAVKVYNARAHWEVAKGNPDQNRAYCVKEGNYMEKGEIPMSQKRKGECEKERWDEALTLCKQGKLDDIPSDILFRYYRTCKEIKKDHMIKPDDANDVTGMWIYRPAGAGKSRLARDRYPNSYFKMANKWWDGYQGEESVIIDDIDPKHGVLGHHFKIWGDRYAFPAETKGGCIMIRPSKIIITSQYHPDQIWSDEETLAAIIRRYTLLQLH